MAARFPVGGTFTWNAVDTSHWSATSGGAGGASVPGSGDTVTFDANSGGGTVTVAVNINVTSITLGGYTGTLDFATASPTMVSVNGSGTGLRTLRMGSGTWTLTGGGTVWDFATATNLTLDPGTSTVLLTNATATAKSLTFGGAPIWNLALSVGSSGGVTLTNAVVHDLDCSGWTSSGNLGLNTISVAGNFTLQAGMNVVAGGALNFTGTSGTQQVTTAGVTLDKAITVNAPGATVRLTDNLTSTASRTFTLTAGTWNRNGKNLTVGKSVSNGTATRAVADSAGTVELLSTGVVWDFTSTGMTYGASGTTIKISDASAAAKTFNGGGLSYGTLWLSGSGTGSYTVNGSNHIALLKVSSPPHTVLFEAGSTQVIDATDWSGVAGSLNTVQSTASGVAATLSKAISGTGSDYLTIRDLTVTGGAKWAATNSIDRGNNAGWYLTYPDTAFW